MSTLILVLETQSDKSDFTNKGNALSPLTGQIVSLGMYDLERERGAVYYVGVGNDFLAGSFAYKIRSEDELLEDWWDGARDYDTFVTFNGRSFTIPFLYHRSAIKRRRPSVEIARERYPIKQTMPYHIDLFDELTFYQAMHPHPSLEDLCQAYGIFYRPLGESERAEILLTQNLRPLAESNAQKLLALKQLYEIWLTYFAPRTFLNRL